MLKSIQLSGRNLIFCTFQNNLEMHEGILNSNIKKKLVLAIVYTGLRITFPFNAEKAFGAFSHFQSFASKLTRVCPLNTTERQALALVNI